MSREHICGLHHVIDVWCVKIKWSYTCQAILQSTHDLLLVHDITIQTHNIHDRIVTSMSISFIYAQNLQILSSEVEIQKLSSRAYISDLGYMYIIRWDLHILGRSIHIISPNARLFTKIPSQSTSFATTTRHHEECNDDWSMVCLHNMIKVDCFTSFATTTRHHDERSEEVIHSVSTHVYLLWIASWYSQWRVLYYPSPHGVYRQI